MARAQCIRETRVVGNEEVKLSLFADDVKLYIENPKTATRKLLEIGRAHV